MEIRFVHEVPEKFELKSESDPRDTILQDNERLALMNEWHKGTVLLSPTFHNTVQV